VGINIRKYFLFALLIKGVIFILFAFLFNRSDSNNNINYIFEYSRDYRSYVEPSMNFVDRGGYFELDHGNKLYAHKMPGMLPIFAPLYLIFGFKYGITFLVVIQFLIDSLCCVLVGIICFKLFKSELAFLIGFLLYSFSTIVSVSCHFAVSELLCTSFGVVALYFTVSESQKRNWLLSGLFAAWSVFFRPTAILLILFLPMVNWLMNQDSLKNKPKQFLKMTVIFCLPFLVFESVWIVRNFKVTQKFVPADMVLENFGTPAMKSLFSLVIAYGGDLQSWNPESEMRWFNNIPGSPDYDERYASTNPFPKYAIESGLSLGILKELRGKYSLYNSDSLSDHEKNALAGKMQEMCYGLISSFKSKAPFMYYVVAPLRTLKTFIFIQRPYGFSFTKSGLLEHIVRAWHFFIYYLVLIAFFAGIYVSVKNRNRSVLFLVFLVVGHMLLYGFILRYSENRYLVPMHPFMVIVSVTFFISVISQYFPILTQRLIKKVAVQ
jgi:hypothetical protein